MIWIATASKVCDKNGDGPVEVHRTFFVEAGTDDLAKSEAYIRKLLSKHTGWKVHYLDVVGDFELIQGGYQSLEFMG